MKKLIKNNIIGFIIGVILTSCIGGVAYTYSAKNIYFRPSNNNWNVNNVEDAMNYLKTNTINVNKNNTKENQSLGAHASNRSTSVQLEKGDYLVYATISFSGYSNQIAAKINNDFNEYMIGSLTCDECIVTKVDSDNAYETTGTSRVGGNYLQNFIWDYVYYVRTTKNVTATFNIHYTDELNPEVAEPVILKAVKLN